MATLAQPSAARRGPKPGRARASVYCAASGVPSSALGSSTVCHGRRGPCRSSSFHPLGPGANRLAVSKPRSSRIPIRAAVSWGRRSKVVAPAGSLTWGSRTVIAVPRAFSSCI